MNLLVYRITGPCNRAMYIDRIKHPPGDPKLYYTDEEDMAEAYLAGLRFLDQPGKGRCEVFFISGDEQREEMNMAKARMLLGWEPVARKKLGI